VSIVSPEVGDDLAPEEVDRLLHLGTVFGHEEQAESVVTPGCW